MTKKFEATVLVGIVLFVAVALVPHAQAQATYNRIEFGWSGVYAKERSPLNSTSPFLNWHGYNATIVYNPKPKFGIEADSQSKWSNFNTASGHGSFFPSAYTLLIGPRFEFPRRSHVMPYFHVLGGVTREGDLTKNDGVAAAIGGGVQLYLERHVAIRLGADFTQKHLRGGSVGARETGDASGVRLIAGIIFGVLNKPADGNIRAMRKEQSPPTDRSAAEVQQQQPNNQDPQVLQDQKRIDEW